MLVEDEQCYFYQCDQIGTPLALVDEQGSVVWQARYDTYGRAHIEVESVGNPLRFKGNITMWKQGYITTLPVTTTQEPDALFSQTRLGF